MSEGTSPIQTNKEKDNLTLKSMGYSVSLPPSMGEGMSSKSIVRIHINITHEKK